MKKMVIMLFILVAFLSFLIINTYQTKADDQGIIRINVIDSGECILNFKQGWNLFSFCSELTQTNIDDVFLDIQGSYRYIMRWNDIAQEFDIYSVRAATNPFTSVNDDESYFIYLNEDATLDVSGSESGAESRNLIEGWNTPSYPYRSSLLITDMIAGIDADVRYIMKWNNINQEFDIYSVRAATNPFNLISQTEGQFIYMKNPNTLNYP